MRKAAYLLSQQGWMTRVWGFWLPWISMHTILQADNTSLADPSGHYGMFHLRPQLEQHSLYFSLTVAMCVLTPQSNCRCQASFVPHEQQPLEVVRTTEFLRSQTSGMSFCLFPYCFCHLCTRYEILWRGHLPIQVFLQWLTPSCTDLLFVFKALFNEPSLNLTYLQCRGIMSLTNMDKQSPELNICIQEKYCYILVYLIHSSVLILTVWYKDDSSSYSLILKVLSDEN